MFKQNCATCEHFRGLSGVTYELPNAKSCTANPPQLHQGVFLTNVDPATGEMSYGRFAWSAFPLVHSDRICGSWKSKECSQ